jgi:predicted metal-binding protein
MPPEATTLFVCVTCRAADTAATEPRAGAVLRDALALEAGDLEVVGVECLSNCQRGCSVAVGAPGKWTYIVGDLDPARHVADVVTFARQHQASADGITVWRERPVHIRKNTIARVPPLRAAQELT